MLLFYPSPTQLSSLRSQDISIYAASAISLTVEISQEEEEKILLKKGYAIRLLLLGIPSESSTWIGSRCICSRIAFQVDCDNHIRNIVSDY
ncbi:uncharacterized protein L199_006881 [Kwoniella botswanensis]|uniref:uncharacterized protein n=1 Tax=Kwoniella botswanensis TaxID=1268659 RepID=UPI00315CD7B3